MATPTDAGTGTGAFSDTRRALLAALEQGEQQLREQAAEIIRRAEERARQITTEAELRAGELEGQLSQLQQEIGEARARLASIRVRSSAPLRGMDTEPANRATFMTPAPVSSETRTQPAAAASPEPTPITSREPSRGSVPAAESAADSAADQSSAGEGESPRETLRALRSALEGNRGQDRG